MRVNSRSVRHSGKCTAFVSFAHPLQRNSAPQMERPPRNQTVRGLSHSLSFRHPTTGPTLKGQPRFSIIVPRVGTSEREPGRGDLRPGPREPGPSSTLVRRLTLSARFDAGCVLSSARF